MPGLELLGVDSAQQIKHVDVALATEWLQNFMKSLPGQTPNMMESFQQAIATANQAFEQISKASTAAMSSVGDAVKKTAAKRK